MITTERQARWQVAIDDLWGIISELVRHRDTDRIRTLLNVISHLTVIKEEMEQEEHRGSKSR